MASTPFDKILLSDTDNSEMIISLLSSPPILLLFLCLLLLLLMLYFSNRDLRNDSISSFGGGRFEISIVPPPPLQ